MYEPVVILYSVLREFTLIIDGTIILKQETLEDKKQIFQNLKINIFIWGK